MSRHVHNYPGSFSEEWDNSSIASLHYLYLALLGKERYAEFTEYESLQSGVNDGKLVRYMGYILIPIRFIFIFLIFNLYARVTEDSFIINRFFSYGEIRYSFGQIKSIEVVETLKKSSKKNSVKKHIVISFYDLAIRYIFLKFC